MKDNVSCHGTQEEQRILLRRKIQCFQLLKAMPKAGFEPAHLAAPPPQDGVSANSTTSALFLVSHPCDRSTHPWERSVPVSHPSHRSTHPWKRSIPVSHACDSPTHSSTSADRLEP